MMTRRRITHRARWSRALVLLAGYVALTPGAAWAAALTTQPADLPVPKLVKRTTQWGYTYHHYRHEAVPYFKGPNVRQASYDFVIRLPVLRFKASATASPPMVVLLHSRGGSAQAGERRWSDHVVLMPDDNTEGIGHSGWFGYHKLAPEPPEPDTPIVPYTERRVMYAIRFAVSQYHVDPHRIWITGGSMGGGGALLLALRHPECIVGVEALKPPVDLRALPMLHPLAMKAFGPPRLELKVQGSDISAWQATSIPWLLAQSPCCRTWVQVEHGRLDRIVPFEQYVTAISPPGQSFIKLFEAGAAPGTFSWDMSRHGGRAMLAGWMQRWNPMDEGLVRLDRPVFVFSNPSLGHLGVPEKLGQWAGRQHPAQHPRGVINGFCRWGAEGLVDQPDRLEVRVWLSDEDTGWQRCPVEEMTYSVSPRGTQRFPMPPNCTYRFRVLPDGLTGRATSNEHGVLVVDKIPLRRGKDNAVTLRIEHAMTLPIVSVISPTHPTLLPRPATSVVAQWTVGNRLGSKPMPVDRYRCWIGQDRTTPPPPEAETSETERLFESVEPGGYTVCVQARLVTGRWGPVTAKRINIDPSWP